MAIGFPTNTVVLIIAVMLGVGAGSWLSLSQGLTRIPAAPRRKRSWRWAAAIFLMSWLLVRLALAVNPPGGADLGPRISIAFFGLGILAGTLPLLISPVFRQVVRAIPSTWLIGIHVIRLAGFLFLALLDMHLLPAAFALPAGYGDMTVGLLAVGVIYLIVTHNPHARALAIGWNLLGLLDLAVALVVGLTIVGPFSAQVVASGISPGYLNYLALVPSFAVPLYAVLHLYSLFQLVPARADATRPGVGMPEQAPAFRAERRSAHS